MVTNNKWNIEAWQKLMSLSLIFFLVNINGSKEKRLFTVISQIIYLLKRNIKWKKSVGK